MTSFLRGAPPPKKNPGSAPVGQGFPKIRQVACVTGKIISSFTGVMYGQLYYRILEHTKTVALKTARGDFYTQMSLTEDCKKELQWYVDN